MRQMQGKAGANYLPRERRLACLIGGGLNPGKGIVYAHAAFLHERESLPYTD